MGSVASYGTATTSNLTDVASLLPWWRLPSQNSILTVTARPPDDLQLEAINSDCAQALAEATETSAVGTRRFAESEHLRRLSE